MSILNALNYDPDSGEITWAETNPGYYKVGDVAGSVNKINGYIYIKHRDRCYLAHRVALMKMGFSDFDQVDHINGIRSDNRIDNLRIVSQTDNLKNKKVYKNNKTGVSGVRLLRGGPKYTAEIYINGKAAHIGTFSDKFDAICARMSANNKHGYHENHGKR